MSSVENLTPGNFVFAFMPVVQGNNIDFRPGGYKLLIIPAEIAKNDVKEIMRRYKERKPSAKDWSYTIKKKHTEVWERYTTFENAWHLLPGTPSAEANTPVV